MLWVLGFSIVCAFITFALCNAAGKADEEMGIKYCNQL
jgi:hypothetical protein